MEKERTLLDAFLDEDREGRLLAAAEYSLRLECCLRNVNLTVLGLTSRAEGEDFRDLVAVQVGLNEALEGLTANTKALMAHLNDERGTPGAEQQEQPGVIH